MSDSRLLVTDPVIELTVREQKFPVTLSYLGSFETHYNGRTLYRKSLEELCVDLMKATKAAKVKMEVHFSATSDGRDMVCHGRHASNHNLIVVDVERGNIIDQWGSGYGMALKPLSQFEKDTYRALLDTAKEANATVARFVKAHEFDLGKEVNRIIEEAIAKEDT